jgi:hypothetical protein
MAVVISPVWSKIRGTIAGTTYLSGPGNPIIARQYVHPVNPSTQYQQMIRNGVAGAVAQWELLTDSERQGWENYAESMGDAGMGRRYFIAQWSLGYYINQRSEDDLLVQVTDSPSLAGLFNFTVDTPVPLGQPGTGFQVPIYNNEAADGGVVLGVLAGPFTPARYKFKGPFPAEGAITQDIAFATGGILSFDNLIENGIYFVKIRGMTGITPTGIPGRLATQTIVRAIATVTAAP